MVSSSIVEIQAWRSRFDELPENVKCLFSDVEANAYEVGIPAIKRALASTGEPGFAPIERIFYDKHPFRVYIKDFLSTPSVWFSLSNLKLRNQVLFRIHPIIPSETFLPARLKRLFSNVAGIAIDSWSIQLSPPLRMQHPVGRRSGLYSLIRYENGDGVYLSEDGQVLSFERESDKLREIDVDDCLDEFYKTVFMARTFEPDFE